MAGPSSCVRCELIWNDNVPTNLWLDDERKPPSYPDCRLDWLWVKTADEAIEALRTLKVEFASLDHDLADEHYFAYAKAVNRGEPVDTSRCKERTGYDVLLWMEENDAWPKRGVRIHTMNPPRKQLMLSVVEKKYGRLFQYQLAGTHPV